MYFCYLSKNKIDNMFETLHNVTVISEKNTKTTEHDLEGSLNSSFGISKLIELIKGGLTFGRKGTIQYESEIKQTYVGKLKEILKNMDSIENLTEVLLEERQLNKIYYTYTGKFRISECIVNLSDREFVTIESNIYIGDKEYKLLLDCSLKNFSDVSPNGKYEIHSSNYGFFTRGLQIRFQTIIILLNYDENIINGTPLYLLLGDDDIII